MAAIRARSNMQVHTNTNVTGMIGIHGHASTTVANPNFGSCSPCIAGVVGSADQEGVTNQNASNAIYVGVVGAINATLGNAAGSGYSLWAKAHSVRFASGNGGLFIEGGFSNASDFAIRSDATAKSYFKGAIDLDSLNPINNGTINNGGSLSPLGMSTRQLSPIGANASVIGTTGATTWRYTTVWKDATGATSAGVLSNNIVAGNATLNNKGNPAQNCPELDLGDSP